MPRATAHTRDGTTWQPMPRPLTSIELQGCNDCMERRQRLIDLELEETVAIRFDSGEVWHCTYGWLTEDTAKGWVNPTPAVALYDALHPVGCERYSERFWLGVVAPDWRGEWLPLGYGWWRRVG